MRARSFPLAPICSRSTPLEFAPLSLAKVACGPSARRPSLNVVEEGHEAEIHVELLVAMEEREAGIIGDEINGGFLVAIEHEDVFANTSRRLASDGGDFECVAMQVNRVDIVTRIAHADAIALPFLQMKRGGNR